MVMSEYLMNSANEGLILAATLRHIIKQENKMKIDMANEAVLMKSASEMFDEMEVLKHVKACKKLLNDYIALRHKRIQIWDQNRDILPMLKNNDEYQELYQKDDSLIKDINQIIIIMKMFANSVVEIRYDLQSQGILDRSEQNKIIAERIK